MLHNQSQKDLRLDVLIMRERVGDKEMWVGQCLQYDIAAQGKTLADLRKCLERVLIGNILLALENDEEPFAQLKPAPDRYWQDYDKATWQSKAFPVSVPGDRLPKSIQLTPSRIPRGEAMMRIAATV